MSELILYHRLTAGYQPSQSPNAITQTARHMRSIRSAIFVAFAPQQLSKPAPPGEPRVLGTRMARIVCLCCSASV